MIKSVTITNHLSESIILELRSPEKSGLQVLGIEGLGPVKASINTTEMPTTDGAALNSTRLQARNILFSLQFLEMPTIQATRRNTYRFFPNKKKIDMTFDSEDRLDYISGYVEDNSVNIFGSDEQKTLISVICPNPYFYSKEIQSTIFSGVTPLFHFPFSNESLVSKLINFGSIFTNKEQTVFYEGDDEIGVILYLHAIGTIVNPVIYNSRTGDLMKILSSQLSLIVAGGFIAGDDIIINTIRGQKSITHIRAGVSKNILNALDKNANWFKIVYGDNLFRFTATTGEDFLELRIDNQIIFSGV